MLGTILLVFAFVLALVAAANIPPAGRWQWGWLALACYFASILFGNITSLLR